MIRWLVRAGLFFAAAVVGAVVLCVGVLWGHLEVERKMPIVDLAQLGATFFLAFYIPLALERYRDRARSTRDLLIDDLGRFVEIVRTINQVITACTHSGKTDDGDRMRVRTGFLSANRRLGLLQKRIKEFGPKPSQALLDELKQKYDAYWRAVTDGNLYGGGDVDWSLWRQQEFAFLSFDQVGSELIRHLRID